MGPGGKEGAKGSGFRIKAVSVVVAIVVTGMAVLALIASFDTVFVHKRNDEKFGSFAELNGLRVGLMICYDVEFPENVRAHALAGTDLLVVPTAQMHPFQFVAESVVPVRAFENQMYVAYVNRTGPEGEFEFVGLSTLAGPDGVARARAGRGEELVLADADPVLLAASRETNPYLKDRRPGLYGSLV